MTLVTINTNPSRRLLVPIVRCQIGDDVFMSGDGMLMGASVSLGEGERSSRCSFEVYDPYQRFAQKYFYASYQQGGLVGLGPPPGSVGGAIAVGATSGSPTSGAVVGNAAACELAIVKECLRQGVTDDNQIAYILGTAKHESDRFATLTEYASGAQYEGRRDLGNVQSGDGVRFKGRGFVQVTGRTNYQKYSKILGKDFIGNPAAIAAPDVSTFTLVHGMTTGTFTGAKLGQYVGGGKADFYNARKTVNSLDEADRIAGYAQNYKAQVPALKAKAGGAVPKPAPVMQKPTEEPPQIETADKGGQVIISMGYELQQLTDFSFIHTGSRFQGTDRNTTSFEGQSVRWLLSRRTKNATYQGITLKQLAAKVAGQYGLTLEMASDGPKFEHLDQTGMTDFKLLQRECDRIGYRLYDKGTKLIVEPRHGRPLGFVLEYGVNMDSFECSDSAQRDQSAGATASQPSASSTTGEIKTVLDPLSGALDQKKKENKAATGLVGGSAAIAATGAKTPAIAPKIMQPEPKEKKGKGKTVKAVKVLFEPGKADKPPAAIPPEPTTEQTAAENKSATQRVKGFPGSATFTTTDAALTVTPDTPFITEGLSADFFNRVWSVDTVTHTYQGSLKTTIKFYSPMLAPISGTSEPTATVAATTNVPGKLANPMPGTPRGTPFDPAGRIRGRPHTGIDMSGGGGKPILAGEAGVVTHAGTRGGYGNAVEIKHSGQWAGWDTFYAHLRSVSVRVGQQVTRGQIVGLEGNTGHSFGDHLHYEVRRNGAYVDPELYFSPRPSGVYGEGARTPLKGT